MLKKFELIKKYGVDVTTEFNPQDAHSPQRSTSYLIKKTNTRLAGNLPNRNLSVQPSRKPSKKNKMNNKSQSQIQTATDQTKREDSRCVPNIEKASFDLLSDQSKQKLDIQERIESPTNLMELDNMARARAMFENANNSQQNEIKLQKRIRQRLRNKLKYQQVEAFGETTTLMKDPKDIKVSKLNGKWAMMRQCPKCNKTVQFTEVDDQHTKDCKGNKDGTNPEDKKKPDETERAKKQEKKGGLINTMKRLESQNDSFIWQMHGFRKDRKSESRLGSQAIRALN